MKFQTRDTRYETRDLKPHPRLNGYGLAPRVAFATLGCKVNFADTEEMMAACRRAELDIVSFDEAADAYVINTCTVTAVADQQSRQMLRRPRRQNPDALVIAMGCLGAVDSESVAAVHGVDAIFGTADRDRALDRLFCHLGIAVTSHESRVTSDESWQSRARAFLKIQDGCSRSCAYCIVPQARGRARSVLPEVIEEACRELGRHHREIVLTGIDIGQYGIEGPSRMELPDLLRRLAGIPGMPRLRLSSLDPIAVDERLVELLISSRAICRHLHLSMQAGTDAVLRRMGRRARIADIERAVALLAEAVPGIAITGDIIAGFPGESHADHEATASWLASLPLAGLHIFPYSQRPGTRAAVMSDQVPGGERRERAARLRAVASMLRRSFLDRMRGVSLEAIVTSRMPDGEGRVAAFTDNAISIALPGGVVAYGDAGRAAITEIEGMQALGRWEMTNARHETRDTRPEGRGSQAAPGPGAS